MANGDARATLELLIKVAQNQIKQLDSVRSGFDGINDEIDELGSKVPRVDTSGLDKLQSELEETVQDAKKARDALKRLPEAGSKLDSLASSFNTVRNAATLFFGSIVLKKIAEVGAEAVRSAADLGRLRNQLSAIEGVDADAVLARIAGRANELGLNLRTLEKDTVNFISSGTRMGLTLEESTKIIEGYSTAALGAGKSSEDLSRAIVQTEQALSKGRFEAQDFKTVLEVFPGALQAVADGLNEDISSIEDFSKKGIKAKDIALALAEELPKVFGGAVQENAKDLIALTERLNNSLEISGRKFGEAAEGGYRQFLERSQEIAEQGDVAEALGRNANVLARIGARAAEAAAGYAKLINAQSKGGEAQEKANQRMADFLLLAAKGVPGFGGFVSVLEKGEEANRKLAESADDAAESLGDLEEAAEDAGKAIEEAGDQGLGDFRANLDELVSASKQAYDEQTDDRLRAIDEQRAAEEAETQFLISQFDQRSKSFSLSEKDRISSVKETSKELLELEEETAKERAEIISEALAEGQEASEEKRAEIIEKAKEDLLGIEEDLQEKREEIAEKGLEKLAKLEEKRAEQARKELDKIAKEEEKLFRKREELLKKLPGLIEKAFKDQDKLFQGPDASGGAGVVRGQIQDIQREIDQLNLLPELSDQDQQRLFDLTQQLTLLERQSGSAAESYSDLQESLANDSAKALESLRQLTDTASFQAGFEQLSEASKSYAQQQIRDFEEAGKAGNLNQQRVRELQETFRELGLTGPEAVGGIADSLRKLNEQPTDITQRLAELNERAEELGRSGDGAASGIDKLADASERVDTAAPGAAAGIRETGSAAADAQAPLEQVGTSVAGLADDLGRMSESVGNLSGLSEIFSIGDNAEGLTLAKDVAAALATSLPIIGPQVQAIQAGVSILSEVAPALLDKLKELQDAETLSTLGPDLTTIGEAVEVIASGSEGLSGSVKALQDLGAENDGITNSAEALERLADPGLVKRLQDEADALLDVAKGVEEVGDKAETAGADDGPIHKYNQRVEDLIRLLSEELEPAVSVALDELDKIPSKLEEIEEKGKELGSWFRADLPQDVGAGVGASLAQLQPLEETLDRILNKLDQVEQRS